MPQSPRLWCADCGAVMHQSKGPLPQGQARCLSCRRDDPRRAAGAPCPQCGAAMSAKAKGARRCLACAQAPRDCTGCGARMPSRNKSLSVTSCSRWCGHFVKFGSWPSTRVGWCACGVASPVGEKKRCECRRQYPKPRTYPSCRVFVTCCRACSQWFCSPYTISTCSAACAEVKAREDKRAAKDRRRASFRGAFVERVYRKRIYERDRWLCKLCGKKVKAGAVVPHPLAPTLDHIVPLACGGLHEAANCQTAHYICNSRKAQYGGGEQLLLIG